MNSLLSTCSGALRRRHLVERSPVYSVYSSVLVCNISMRHSSYDSSRRNSRGGRNNHSSRSRGKSLVDKSRGKKRFNRDFDASRFSHGAPRRSNNPSSVGREVKADNMKGENIHSVIEFEVDSSFGFILPLTWKSRTTCLYNRESAYLVSTVYFTHWIPAIVRCINCCSRRYVVPLRFGAKVHRIAMFVYFRRRAQVASGGIRRTQRR